MNYENFLPEVITGFSSAFAGWLFARRKYKAETESNEIENLDKAVALWRTIAEDLKEDNDAVRAQEKTMREEILELRNRISDLEKMLIKQK